MNLDLVGKLHRNFCSPRFQESAFRENLVSLPPSSLTLWFKITVGKGEEEEEGEIYTGKLWWRIRRVEEARNP